MHPWLIPTAPAAPLAGIVYAFRESTAPGQFIVLLLVAGSIVAWGVMLTKVIELRAARRSSLAFLAAFRKEAHPAGLFLRNRVYKDSPLFFMYRQTCASLAGEIRPDHAEDPQGERFAEGLERPRRRLTPAQLNALRDVTEGSMAEQTLRLEDHMGVLATAISTSPFLGLLGTVWGVMDAFGGMAVRGVATLSAVAPGISAALLTTVVGLLVALPSTVGYNLLTHRIRHLCVQMENYAQELAAALQRVYGES